MQSLLPPRPRARSGPIAPVRVRDARWSPTTRRTVSFCAPCCGTISWSSRRPRAARRPSRRRRGCPSPLCRWASRCRGGRARGHAPHPRAGLGARAGAHADRGGDGARGPRHPGALLQGGRRRPPREADAHRRPRRGPVGHAAGRSVSGRGARRREPDEPWGRHGGAARRCLTPTPAAWDATGPWARRRGCAGRRCSPTRRGGARARAWPRGGRGRSRPRW